MHIFQGIDMDYREFSQLASGAQAQRALPVAAAQLSGCCCRCWRLPGPRSGQVERPPRPGHSTRPPRAGHDAHARPPRNLGGGSSGRAPCPGPSRSLPSCAHQRPASPLLPALAPAPAPPQTDPRPGAATGATEDEVKVGWLRALVLRVAARRQSSRPSLARLLALPLQQGLASIKQAVQAVAKSRQAAEETTTIPLLGEMQCARRAPTGRTAQGQSFELQRRPRLLLGLCEW